MKNKNEKNVSDEFVYNETPIEIIEGHGSRLKGLMDPNLFVEKYLEMIANKGSVENDCITDVYYEDKLIKSTTVAAIKYSESSLDFLSIIAKKGTSFHFLTCYPHFEGIPNKVTITSVYEWKNKVEALVTCKTENMEFSFFATDYYLNKKKYMAGNELEISLFALAHEVMKPDAEIKIEGSDALNFLKKMGENATYDKEGNVMPVIFSTEALVAFFNCEKNFPDSAQFQSPISKIESTNFLDVELCKTTISIQHDPEMQIPLYFRRDNLNEELSDLQSLAGGLFLSGYIYE